ncbi:MAG: amino acid permease [Phycisphaerae bacterium]|nr:amino acid permease [Phycisphaerae bacterium]
MKLKRELNLLHVFSIASGGMLSAGFFILPGIAHAMTGPAVIVSYVLAGLLAMTGMLSQAELASAMPKAGGSYFYVTRSMGPAVGTIYGLITWFALCLKSAFALVGIGVFSVLILPVPPLLILIPLTVLFVAVNLVGVELAGRIQVLLVLGILATLLVFSGLGLTDIDVNSFTPFAPGGLPMVLATAGFIFVSYGGLLKVASIAEEVKDPGRDIPLGSIFALLTIVLLYTLVIFVTVGVLSPQALNTGGPDGTPTLTPISDAAGELLGETGRIVLSVAAILAFLTASNAGIMAASRFPLALARDEMLPEAFGRISDRFKTPMLSTLVTGVMILVALFLEINLLVKAASTVLILSFAFTCLSVIILRESRLQNYQPQFKAPLYPWMQIAGAIGFVLLLLGIGQEALLTSILLMAAGLFVYWFYGRIRATREFALLHLIERITAKELTSHLLETELKEIVRERDVIVKDRFDHIIEEDPVLDVDEPVTADQFFRLAADALAPKLEVPPEEFYRLLIARERESSTVLSPFLAIPHIVIPGEHKFDILLARCKPGIAFSDDASRVHTVFCLVGTRDERPFHLRALAAIAAIVQDPDFDRRWMAAKTKESLRDLVLLGKRKRQE